MKKNTTKETYDVIVIGCGIIGASIAYRLSRYNLKTLVLEKENDVAKGATKANSAIIHAGYDPEEGTLMAKLNVRGAELAEQICRDLDVPYKKNGALVVGFDEKDFQTISALYNRGRANGVKGLKVIDADEIRKLEPNVNDKASCALYVPDSAICLPWEYAFAMAETSVKNGVELKLEMEVRSIKKTDECWQIETGEEAFNTRYVINASGENAAIVHNMALPETFSIKPNRGEYFLLDKTEGEIVSRTIFPCPSEAGKGILAVPTVHGNLLVGPNSENVERNNTVTTRGGLDAVKKGAMEMVPSIDFSQNIRNFAGVRARSDRPDFIIEEHQGFVDCAGICSPGLSAAPAVAEFVEQLLCDAGLFFKEKSDAVLKRKKIRIKELSVEERTALVMHNPEYGEIVCRCEGITLGEIMDCFDSPIPPKSVDGVKRRAGTGMGRCQGGFCSPIVVELLSRKLGCSKEQIIQDSEGSNILYGMIGG